MIVLSDLNLFFLRYAFGWGGRAARKAGPELTSVANLPLSLFFLSPQSPST